MGRCINSTEGMFARRAGRPSQCFTHKHHSLLEPRNPQHKWRNKRTNAGHSICGSFGVEGVENGVPGKNSLSPKQLHCTKGTPLGAKGENLGEVGGNARRATALTDLRVAPGPVPAVGGKPPAQGPGPKGAVPSEIHRR